MAKKFLTGLTLVNLDSDPLVGSEGELYFNSSASVAKIYKAGEWSVIGEGAGGSNVVISETDPESPSVGDLWYQASIGSFSIYDGEYWVEVNGIIENPPISQEEVQDYVSPLFEHNNHTNISAIYDDINNQILLSASASSTGAGIIVSTTAPEDPEVGTGWYNNETGVLAIYDGTYWVEVNGVIENPALTQEEIQDYISPLFEHNNHINISASYDDDNNEIILSASASGGVGTGITISETAPESPQEGDGWYNNASGSFYLYDGSYWVEVNGIIDGLTEDQVQDYASSLFTHNNHTGITVTYDDANNQILLEGGDTLPSQTGNSGKYLTTSGSVTSWGAIDLSSYLSTSSASSIYLTQTTASNTYLTQVSASTTYPTSVSIPGIIEQNVIHPFLLMGG